MSADIQTVSVSKKMLWTGRVISALPVLALVFSATMKLMKPPGIVDGFKHFGYPEELIRVLGIVELSCAVIYIIPRTSILGAILMTGYLGGAVATHARLEDPAFIMPFLAGVLVWLGLFLREPRLRALIPLRS
jgi:hypothetical protein